MTFSFNGIETQNFVHTKLSQNHLAIHLLHPSSLTFYLLTHWLLGFFAKNALFFWTFWRFSAWTCAKLPPIYPKNHLQHNSLPAFSVAWHFTPFSLRHVQKSKKKRKWPKSFRLLVFFEFFFRLSFFLRKSHFLSIGMTLTFTPSLTPSFYPVIPVNFLATLLTST